MNKTHRSVWNARTETYVAVAETVSAKGKPSSGVQASAVVTALFGGLIGLGAHAQNAPPPNALPTGGQVSAGQAAISQNGAHMVIQQGSDRAAVNWQTFNVGQNAQVQFQQPNAASVTLNRVMSSDPSQIFGRISANGQVVLTNPQGVYFGRSARVDVGGLVATTNSISDADFMAGKNRYERNGSTGTVINEGELKAALGGYIALLAPEVRNQGAVIAQMGTVAMAAGEAVDLHFDSQNRLTSIRVDPAQIKTLVDNRHAVQAPGGLIILSAQSMDRLLGGVVKNSGRIEADGLRQQGGRIVLSASARVENTGAIVANATVDDNVNPGVAAAESGPAGQISLSAPEVINRGAISASGAGHYAAGSVRVDAERFVQTAGASIRAEAAARGGQIKIVASQQARVAGELSVAAVPVAARPAAKPEPVAAIEPATNATPVASAAPTVPGTGGDIEIQASNLTLDSARLDASGDIGGRLRLNTGAIDSAAESAPVAPTAPIPTDPRDPGHLAITGNSILSVRGRRGRGGNATLTGDDIALNDATRIDATGTTGGGTVLVGGGWQGSGGLHQANRVDMAHGASIDASATEAGDGGTVVLWSDVDNAASFTTANGSITARGGANKGDGGRIETSGHRVETDGIRVDAGAPQGIGGLWLIDPADTVIDQTVANGYQATLNTGTSVTNDVTGAITWNSGVTLNKTAGGAATLTLRTTSTGSEDIVLNGAQITSTSNALNLVLWTRYNNLGPAGAISILNSTITTNGGSVWAGSGSAASWNGLTVGNNTAATYTGGKQGVLVRGSNLTTGAGSIYLGGLSYVTGSSDGIANYGVFIDTGSQLLTTSGNITLNGEVKGKYSAGSGVWIGGNNASVGGNVQIESGSGAINIAGNGQDQSGSAAGYRLGIMVYTPKPGDQLTVRSGSGAITLNGDAAFGAGGDFTTDTSGVQLQANNADNKIQVVSTSGAITITAQNTQQTLLNENAIRFTAANGANNIRIGTDGTTAYSGDILIEGDSIQQRNQNSGAGSIAVQTSGNLTIAPKTASFTALRAGASAALTFDDDWNFGTTLGSFALGKAGNTADLTLSNALATSGPIKLYGGSIAVNANLTSTALTSGDILLQASTLDVLVAGSITSNSGNAAVALSAKRHVRLGTNATISSNTGPLNVNLRADTNNDGDGIVYFESSGISTNGGNLTFGADGQYATIGSTSVRVGGDVFFQRGSAQTLSTGGGALNVWGETIVSNTFGLTVNSGGGNVTFNGLLNSGNAYGFQSSGNNWNTARTAARNGTSGGSAVNDSYLVTITSRLENSIAGLAANYQGTWIGNWRANTSNYAWSWADGPEAGQVFFNQNGGAGGGGTATVGSYANFGASEPNGNLSGSESVGQFYGTSGQWNDLPVENPNTGIYGTVGYVRETNLAGSPVTINAGAGAVTFNGSVGGTKALASLNVVSGSTAVNGTALITTGAQTYNNALTVTSTDDLQVSATSLSVTNASQSATFKATGNITQKSGMAVATNGGNVIYWADSDATGTDSIAGGSISTAVGSIATGGGKLVMAGGGDTNGDGIPDGFAFGAFNNEYGLNIDGTTLNAGTGDILLRGRSTGTSSNTNIGVRLHGNGIPNGLAITAGKFTAEGVASTKGATDSKNGWGVGIEGVNLTASGNVSITGTGGTSTTGYGNIGVLLGGNGGTIATTAIDKTITFNGTGGSGSGGDNDGVAINSVYTIGSSTTGAISITGTTASDSANTEGISVRGNLQSGASGTAINVNGTSTGNTLANNGVLIDSTGLQVTGSGGISVTGTSGRAAVSGVAATTSNILASSGPIVLDGGVFGVNASGSTFGKKASTSVLTSTSDVTLTGNVVSFSGASSVDTTGKLAVKPFSASFTSALSWPLTNLTLGSGVSGLTLGKDGNTANITIASATTVAGPIAIYGGNIAVNAGLTATGASSAIALKASGTITQSAALTADKLALLGGTTVTLTNASNNIGTLAASGVGSLTYIDSNALTLGSVGTTNGVDATGVVNIGTGTGDLTVAQNVATSNTSATALTLNAGISTAAGTATGGNILISGSPTVSVGSVGSGGTARLFSGSVAGSTGLTTLVGSGSGRFRYNSDEAATNYSLALPSGVSAIYRERPTATIANLTLAMTYGEALPGINSTGLVNGDGSLYVITGRTNSTSGNIQASASAYAVTSGLGGLGYNISGPTTGTLTVAKKDISVSGLTVANKVYDGTTAATLNGGATLTGAIAGDTVSVGSSGATFDNKNAGLGKTVTLGGGVLTGVDSANYNPMGSSTISADITAKQVTLSASKTYDGSTALAGAVSVGGLVGAETLGYTGATSNDSHVATAGKFINAIALVDGTNGGIASNYQVPSLDAVNAPVVISAASLTASLTNTGVTKTYDGTTNAPAGFVPAYTFTGLVGGDTGADIGNTSASFNDQNVATATTLTVGGLSVAGITGSNGSQATDYVLAANSLNTAATIGKANLTVTANNDAKFVTQTDGASYAGVSYSGFVGGETSSALSGTPTVSRSNAGNNIAGVYTGVLNATGLSSDNYAITYATGDYNIVPSGQLLVRVNDASSTYGTNTAYSVGSASYWDPAANAGAGGEVVLAAATSNGSNNFTVNDGAGGLATFTLVPGGGLNSGAGFVRAGAYQLAASGTVTQNSANFSDTLTIVGSHTISQKNLTASATGGVSKTYDGTTAMNGVAIGLAGKETSDDVTVAGAGAFSGKNAGTNLTYTINNLALSGSDSGNYYLSGGTSFNGGNGVITAKAVTLTPGAASKVYDGTTAYTLSASDLTALSTQLGVSGDSVTAGTASFDDKNVATGKTLTGSATTISDGNGGNNYVVTLGNNAASQITRLNSVAWTGPATGGNWFDPANWAGGAVPDRANVANVVIPQGAVVSFDTAGAVLPADGTTPVSLESLGSAGSLTQSNGSLNVGTGGIALASLTQTGGTLTNAGTTAVDSFSQARGSFSGSGAMTAGQFSKTGGSTTLGSNLTVTQDFSQGANGSVVVGGTTQITDTNGGMQLGNLNSIGPLTVVSTGGAITQASGTVLAPQSTSSFTATQGGVPADIALTNAGNNFVGEVSLSGAGVQITDVDALALGTVTTTGDLTANSTGALNLGTTTVGGALNANSGNGSISQTGPLSVIGNITLDAGTGDITLANAANDFGGTVLATGKDITLADANALTTVLNASGNSSVSAGGDLMVSGLTQNLTTVTTNGGTTTYGATTVAGNLGTVSAGDVSQTGAMTVTGTTLINASGHNVGLSNAGNDFTGPVSVSGKTVQITDANALTLGTVTATENLTVASTGALNLGTSTVGGALNVNSGNGNISQTGPVTVAGASTLNAGTGSVNLGNPANNLAGGITTTAGSSVIAGDRQGDAAAAVAAEAAAAAQAAADKAAADKTAADKAAADKAAADKAAADKTAADKAAADKAAADKAAGDKAAADKAAADQAAADRAAADEAAADKAAADRAAADKAAADQAAADRAAADRAAGGQGTADSGAADMTPVGIAAADRRNTDPGTIVSSIEPVIPMPGTGLSNASTPAALVLDSTTAAPSCTSGSIGNSPALACKTSGVIVVLKDQPSADGVRLVAVSLPRGAGATGFGFVLPPSVRELLAAGAPIQASLANGSTLPASLRFDAKALRFDASAQPSVAIPNEVFLVAGKQRVEIVISERKE